MKWITIIFSYSVILFGYSMLPIKCLNINNCDNALNRDKSLDKSVLMTIVYEQRITPVYVHTLNN